MPSAIGNLLFNRFQFSGNFFFGMVDIRNPNFENICVAPCCIYTEKDYLGKSLKAQMKYADKVGAKYTVVLGDDEIANKTAVAKNMATKEQITLDLTKSIREQLK